MQETGHNKLVGYANEKIILLKNLYVETKCPFLPPTDPCSRMYNDYQVTKRVFQCLHLDFFAFSHAKFFQSSKILPFENLGSLIC